jgi:hypothetical protein
MAYNYSIDADNESLTKWNSGLNLEDMDHDAGAPNNTLYKACRDSLFDDINSLEYPDLMYVKPIIISKKNLYTKPQMILENYSIRDTEPAWKLSMDEKYTPAYYFDPASRKYPVDFPETVTRLHNKTIDLKKYGLNITLSFKLINNSLKETPIKPTVLATTININNRNFKDKHTEYIHKTGYAMGKTKTGSQLLIPNRAKHSSSDYDYLMSQILILGNGEKDHFFKTNAAITSPDIFLRGQRMIVYKLLGDLLHAVLATPDDLVFTLDTYLKDRCRKNGIAVVAKESNLLDVLFNKKTKLYDVWIDKLYDRDEKKNPYEITGGTKGKAKKAPAKVLSKGKKNKQVELTGKEGILKEGREEIANVMTSRKSGNKYKKILVSCFNYHPANEIIPDEEMDVELPESTGGNNKKEYENLDRFPEYRTLKELSGQSITELLQFVETKIENQMKLNNEVIENANKNEDIGQELTYNTELTSSVDSLEQQILMLIKNLYAIKDEKTIGVSDKMAELVELLVDDANMLFEGDLEIYLLRSICKDDKKALEMYNIMNSLTDEHGLFVYDYRLLLDFVENIELIKDNTPEQIDNIKNDSNFDFLNNKINEYTRKKELYQPTIEDLEQYSLMSEENRKEIDEVKKNNYTTHVPNVNVPNVNVPTNVFRNGIEMYAGGKFRKTKKNKKNKIKKLRKKTIRIQIKKKNSTRRKKN